MKEPERITPKYTSQTYYFEFKAVEKQQKQEGHSRFPLSSPKARDTTPT